MSKEQLIESLSPIMEPFSMRQGLDDGYLLISKQHIYFICQRMGEWTVRYDLKRYLIVNVEVNTGFWKSSLIIKSKKGTVTFTKIPKDVDFKTLLTIDSVEDARKHKKKTGQSAPAKKADSAVKSASLILNENQSDEQVFMLIANPCHIGRGRDSSIQIMDASLSRRHCVINQQENRYFIQDLQSSNGTTVNGTAVSQKELFGEEELGIGDIVFRFRLS